jgi:hypothetical protein
VPSRVASARESLPGLGQPEPVRLEEDGLAVNRTRAELNLRALTGTTAPLPLAVASASAEDGRAQRVGGHERPLLRPGGAYLVGGVAASVVLHAVWPVVRRPCHAPLAGMGAGVPPIAAIRLALHGVDSWGLRASFSVGWRAAAVGLVFAVPCRGGRVARGAELAGAQARE